MKKKFIEWLSDYGCAILITNTPDIIVTERTFIKQLKNYHCAWFGHKSIRLLKNEMNILFYLNLIK